MPIIKLKSSPQSPILSNPNPNPKSFRSSSSHYTTSHSIPTINFSPIQNPSFLKPLILSHKPYLCKIKATLTPSPILTSIPSISSILSTIMEISKQLIVKIKSLSLHELHVPYVAIVIGLGKWLDLYNSILMVRVLLSWFPNMPWERQPFSAIRDLCDPYLMFFRKIMPPFQNMDLSPILAFMVLGVVSSILNASAGGGATY